MNGVPLIESAMKKERPDAENRGGRITMEASKMTALLNTNISTEEFLSRVNMNDKINSILRSPTSATGVRQRSVFTSITPTPSRVPVALSNNCNNQQRFNSALMSNLPSSLPNCSADGAANINSAFHGAAGAAPVLQKDVQQASAQTQTHRHFANLLQNINQPPVPTNVYYDPPMSNRPSGAITARNIFNRYSAAPAQGTSAYKYEVDYRMFPQPMPPPPYVLSRLGSTHRFADVENPSQQSCPGTGPISMPNGTIQLRLRDGIRIDMTLDKSVRVVNMRSMVAAAFSRHGSNIALIHPNGRVLQTGSKVEIVTFDGMKTNNYVRYAKMWYKGVSFTSESCALIYLVDTAGTRTTTDTFTDMSKDHTLTIFYDDCRHGPNFVAEANELIQASTYSCGEDGTETYEINGFRIAQSSDGLVKVTRSHNKYLIRTSPGNGSVTLTTPGIHCTASLGKTSHLFVRRNEKRMHFDGSCFIVRNAGHSAGFNENNLLIVY